jgi:hypothetical protein
MVQCTSNVDRDVHFNIFGRKKRDESPIEKTCKKLLIRTDGSDLINKKLSRILFFNKGISVIIHKSIWLKEIDDG